VSTRQSALDLQYVRYSVTALINGILADPTTNVVTFAFLPAGTDPQAGDWKVASWETVAGPPVSYVARCLVGPGGVFTPTRGASYQVWIKIAASPELLQWPVGVLEVF
jgi:hypothetical protein